MSRLKRLILEIHRRSVWQVLGIYLVGGWAVWKGVGSIYEYMGLPDWVPATALIILLAGLPLVIATAFVQEGGPQIGRTMGAEPPGRPGAPADDDPTIDAGHTGTKAVMGDSEHPADGEVEGESKPAADPGGVRGVFTWNRAITAVVLAFALLGLAATGFMGMRWLGIGPAATLISSGELDARDPIVLADFTVSARDTTLGVLVTEALRVDLEGSPVVSLAARPRIQAVLERMRRDSTDRLTEEVAREAAIREGMKAVLAGEVREAGGSYLLAARLVTADSGRVLAAFRETAADSTVLIAAIDRLSSAIRSGIGESLRSVRAAPPLSQVTTSSLAALRLYAQGRYEDAVALDSTFASAWRAWGVVLSNYGLMRGLQIDVITRAYELRGRLTPRERAHVESIYHINVTGDLAKAEQAFHTLLASYPDDVRGRNNLGVVLRLRGNVEAALHEFRIACDLDPRALYFNQIAVALARMGERERALAVLDSAELLYPDLHSPLRARAARLIEMGRYDQADSVAAQIRERWGEESPANWFILAAEAEADAVRGRIDEATGHLERRQWLNRMSGYEVLVPERLETAAAAAKWLAGIEGDRAQSLGILRDALATVPLDSLRPPDRPYGDLAEAFAYASSLDRARALVAGYDSVAGGHWTYGDDQLQPVLRARGVIALEENRPRDALDHFRDLNNMFPSCRDSCALPLIGWAHELAGRPDSAIAAYEAYLHRLDTTGRGHTAVFLTLTLRRLPELYEVRGEGEAAARLYTRFIDLWKDADPELQPRVEAARRALARLTREGV